MKIIDKFLDSRFIRLLTRLNGIAPTSNKERVISGLQSSINVKIDAFGIPTINASSRLDAMCALGYLTAYERLFQMDLLRRTVSGRLSEILGSQTLELDVAKRTNGFCKVAKQIVDSLPRDQRDALDAYVRGVNAYIAGMHIPPFECLLLRYRPEPWTIEDSILVGLYIMDEITGVGEEENERMMTIMSKTLPADVFAFLTPDEDSYTTILTGGDKAWRPIQRIPVQSLALLLRNHKKTQSRNFEFVQASEKSRGSNAWVVSKVRTAQGRSILANDMHLPLSVPNIWYRACIHYGTTSMMGLVLPGLPVMIAGSNGSLAWGSTNINGDFLDLITLDINPLNSNEYMTPNGWKPFKLSQELIHVKGGNDITVDIKETIWGPVSPYPLMGRAVAIRWTALDPDTVNINWIDIDKVKSVKNAIDFVHECGGPPLNIMLADNTGHVAWTLCGKIPIRKGFDGMVSQSWSTHNISWAGYIPSDQLPQVIDPSSGFMVTANNRTVGNEYPYIIGHHFANGYRAHYISRVLRDCEIAGEQQFVDMQLDTTTKFYDFYDALALDLLTQNVIVDNSLLRDARTEIEAWDGKADLNSRGIAILVQFRKVLIEEIFGSYLEVCKEADENFYFRHNAEGPLRMIITEKCPEILPDSENYTDWTAFLLGSLEKAIQRLRNTYKFTYLSELTWSTINITDISHPLSSALPNFLKRIIDMPRSSLPGCVFCVRVADSQHGASMRMVISPGHEEHGKLYTYAGQSGRPFSSTYRNQHEYWVHGEPLPFLPGKAVQELQLVPPKK